MLSTCQWRNIRRFCAATVAEIECHSEYIGGLSFPNLKKLVILEDVCHPMYLERYAINSPQLEHLELKLLHKYNGLGIFDSQLNLNGHFLHLTTIKVSQFSIHVQKLFYQSTVSNIIRLMFQIGCYNEHVAEFLLALEEATCQNMKILSLDNNTADAWEKYGPNEAELYSKLLNMLKIFRNLSALHLLLPHIADQCTEKTLENNSKLVDLSLCDYFPNFKILEYIANSCVQIEYLRIVDRPLDKSKPHFKIIPEKLQQLFPNKKIEAP